MKCKLITLMIFAIVFILAALVFLCFAVLSENWHSIRVNLQTFVLSLTEKSEPPVVTTTEISTTEMYNITLPPFHVPNCTCKICPNITIYINVTFSTPSTPTTTPTTTIRTKRYRTTRSRKPRPTTRTPTSRRTKKYRKYRRTRSTTKSTKKTRRVRKSITSIIPFLAAPIKRNDHEHHHHKVVQRILRQPDETKVKSSSDTDTENSEEFISNYIRYNRQVGLYMMCFTENRQFHLPLKQLEQEHCVRIDDAAFYNRNATDEQRNLSWQKVHMLRACLAFFILAILLALLAFIGLFIVGCFGWPPFVLGILSLMLFVGFISGLLAILLFHTAETAEMKSWDQMTRATTSVTYDYAYIIAWIGVILLLLNTVLVNLLAAQMYRRLVDDQEESIFYYYYYGGNR